MRLSDIITKQVWLQIWQYIIKLIAKGKNLPAWSLQLLTYIGQYLYKIAVDYIEKKKKEKFKKEREQAQEKAKEEFDKIKDDSKTTADEFGNKFEDMINAGKD